MLFWASQWVLVRLRPLGGGCMGLWFKCKSRIHHDWCPQVPASTGKASYRGWLCVIKGANCCTAFDWMSRWDVESIWIDALKVLPGMFCELPILPLRCPHFSPEACDSHTGQDIADLGVEKGYQLIPDWNLVSQHHCAWVYLVETVFQVVWSPRHFSKPCVPWEPRKPFTTMTIPWNAMKRGIVGKKGFFFIIIMKFTIHVFFWAPKRRGGGPPDALNSTTPWRNQMKYF